MKEVEGAGVRCKTVTTCRPLLPLRNPRSFRPQILRRTSGLLPPLLLRPHFRLQSTSHLPHPGQ